MTTNMLMMSMPAAAAIGMPLWIAWRRRRDQRWGMPWLVTLLPLGVVAALDGLGLMADLGSAPIKALIILLVIGLAAFAGGLVYLTVPAVLGTLGASLADWAMHWEMNDSRRFNRADRATRERREREEESRRQDDELHDALLYDGFSSMAARDDFWYGDDD